MIALQDVLAARFRSNEESVEYPEAYRLISSLQPPSIKVITTFLPTGYKKNLERAQSAEALHHLRQFFDPEETSYGCQGTHKTYSGPFSQRHCITLAYGERTHPLRETTIDFVVG